MSPSNEARHGDRCDRRPDQLDPETRWLAMTLGLVLEAVDIADCWATTALAELVDPDEGDATGALVLARYYRIGYPRMKGHPQHPQAWPVTVTATDPATGTSRVWVDTMLVRTDAAYIDPGVSRFAGFVDTTPVACREAGNPADTRSLPLGTIEIVTPSDAHLSYCSTALRPMRAPPVRGDHLDALMASLSSRHRAKERGRLRAGEPIGFDAGLRLLEHTRHDPHLVLPFSHALTGPRP